MKKSSIGQGPKIVGVIVGGIKGSAVKKAVDGGADVLELRVDTFKEKDPEYLKKVIKTIYGRLPLLITVRSRKEGGKYAIPDKKRVEIFEALMPFADTVDIELSSGGILKNVVESAGRHGKKVIVSYHNFKSTPGTESLRDIIKRGKRSGGDIVKIATTVRGPEDLKRLAKILTDFNNLIVIGMGRAGSASRVFFPFLGSLLTYGSITASTAPGQLTLKELKKEFGRYGL